MKYTIVLLAFLASVSTASAFTASKIPTACTDSDGDCMTGNIAMSDNVYETLDLLTYPYGWLNVTSFSNPIDENYIIKNATVSAEWHTDSDMGAGNIYIEYYNGTAWVSCAGPLSATSTDTITSCDVSQLNVSQLNSMRVRFRGEDTDGFPNAFAYVDYVNVTIEYSFLYEKLPTVCKDSDGDCMIGNINQSDDVYETLDLLTYPYGWLNVTSFGDPMNEDYMIKDAILSAEWHTDSDMGAGNIYIEYYNGTAWVSCAGPLSATSTDTITSCDVSQLNATQLNNIRVRFRGEDTDGFPNAFAYVDFISLSVNPDVLGIKGNLEVSLIYPSDAFTNIAQNKTFYVNASVTCRTGACYNIIGTVRYNASSNNPDTPVSSAGKPFYLTSGSATKSCSNNPLYKDESCVLSWLINASGDTGTSWKIGVLFESSDPGVPSNHTTNATVNITTEYVFSFGKIPLECMDSDGDCLFSNINQSDDVYEMVDLLTYPYGWINVTSFSNPIDESYTLRDASLTVEWHTDTWFGADNINIDYYNGTDWMNCGSGDESATDTITSCDISSLSLNQINNIRVRFRGEDTDGFPNAFAYVDYFFVSATIDLSGQNGTLEVYMTYPNTTLVTNVAQNRTFAVNATVQCRSGPCFSVNGTVRYNATSNPDTPINATAGGKPFYIIGDNATKSCGFMQKDDVCHLSWIINATGEIGSGWKIGVLFESSDTNVPDNHTANATINIIPCPVDFTIMWNSLGFGNMVPNTGSNPAPGNANNIYNISISGDSCYLDLYIRGTNLTNSTTSGTIGVGNITWNNMTNSYLSSVMLRGYNNIFHNNSVPATNVTMWYWINVPPIYAGWYNGSIIITGAKHE